MDILNHYEIKTGYFCDCKTTEYYKNGELHRDDDLPAYKEVNGKNIRYIWYVNGKIHREAGKPADIEFKKGRDGIYISYAGWKKNGEFNRERYLPTVYNYSPNSQTFHWDGYEREGYANINSLTIKKQLGRYTMITEDNQKYKIDETEAHRYIPQQLYPEGYDPLADLKDEFAFYDDDGEIITDDEVIDI